MAATAEKKRGTQRRDVAKFLAAHEHCQSDLEIRRPTDPADGRLRLVCNGCGASAAYDVGQPGVLKLLDGGRVKPVPAVAPGGRGRLKPSQEQMQRWLPTPPALPWWVPSAYIFAIIAVGLAMIAFGVLRPDGRDRALFGDGGVEAPSEPVPATPPPVNQAGSEPAPAGPPKAKAKPDAGPHIDLRRITVLSRFRVGVPDGWGAGARGGAVAFAAPGGDAELRVYLEPGDRPPRELARDAARFLRDAHPGASLSPVRAFRQAGDSAAAIEASYKGGTDRAVLISESGYEYLLLSSVDESVSGRSEAAAAAALQSFSAL
jgi:hypothetical protein